MKLVVNAYMSVLIEGVAESLTLGRRLGIEPAQLPRPSRVAPSTLPSPTPNCTRCRPVTSPREFPLEWALKDVDLALSAATDAPLPLLAALSSQWQAAVDSGHSSPTVVGWSMLGGDERPP